MFKIKKKNHADFLHNIYSSKCDVSFLKPQIEQMNEELLKDLTLDIIEVFFIRIRWLSYSNNSNHMNLINALAKTAHNLPVNYRKSKEMLVFEVERALAFMYQTIEAVKNMEKEDLNVLENDLFELKSSFELVLERYNLLKES